MKIFLSSCLILLFVLAGTPAQAIEPFALLDDFSGDRINDGIWDGSRRPDSDILDVAREVKDGELHLLSRSYADFTPPGTTKNTAVRLFLKDGDSVTQMAARFRVNALEMNGCTGSNAGNIAARLAGYWFTHSGPPDPFSADRNVFANIRILRNLDSLDPPGVMRVAAVVFLCGDPDCETGTDLLFDDTTLGTITPGQSTHLAMAWDPDNDRFLFARGVPDPVQLLAYSYTGDVTDVDPPTPTSELSFVHKRVEIRARVENCVSGPRASGFMEVFVDNVHVNQSAIP